MAHAGGAVFPVPCPCLSVLAHGLHRLLLLCGGRLESEAALPTGPSSTAAAAVPSAEVLPGHRTAMPGGAPQPVRNTPSGLQPFWALSIQTLVSLAPGEVTPRLGARFLSHSAQRRITMHH